METLPATATEAKISGSPRYFTGKPCPKGHVAERRTINTSCMECHRERNKEKTPGRAKARKAVKFRKRYGCEISVKTAAIDRQGGKCKICLSEATLFLDHCHSTGKIRDALCHHCNVALGHVKDSPTVLRAMAVYLETHATHPAPSRLHSKGEVND